MMVLLKKLNKQITRFMPAFVSERTNPGRLSIKEFVKLASKETKQSDYVLDAGAGHCPYKQYFSHTHYESTDIQDEIDTHLADKHAFLCDLAKIPKVDESYDVILSTEVLEHVPNPQKVVNEFYRVLKPKGKLFVTVPQGMGVHGAPYHFFNFIEYGLKFLFLTAGFKVRFIKPRGGIFWMVGHKIKLLPYYILKQYMPKRNGKFSCTDVHPLFFILFPIYLTLVPFCSYLIPLLFFYLDSLDKNQSYTLGYSCYCVKE